MGNLPLRRSRIVWRSRNTMYENPNQRRSCPDAMLIDWWFRYRNNLLIINDNGEVFKVTKSKIKIQIPIYRNTFPDLVDLQRNTPIPARPASRIMICVIWGGCDAVKGSEMGKYRLIPSIRTKITIIKTVDQLERHERKSCGVVNIHEMRVMKRVIVGIQKSRFRTGKDG